MPQSTIRLSGGKSVSGRPLYDDPEGGVYSEKTVTFPLGKKWVTFPSVDASGNIMSEDAVAEYVRKNGPKDPVTGEIFPMFDTVDDATNYARERSSTRVAPESEPQQSGGIDPRKIRMLKELQRRGVLTGRRAKLAEELIRRSGGDAQPAQPQDRMAQIRAAGNKLGREAGPVKAAVLNAGEGVFGLASRVGAGIDYMTQDGDDFTYDEMLEYRRAQAQGAYDENPVSGTAGYVGGMVLGSGGVAGTAARAAPRAAAALAPKADQTIRNIGRYAAGGAAAGGAQAAGEGALADAKSGAVTGAVAGPLGRAAYLAGAKVLERAVRPTKAAIRKIASGIKRADESMDEAYSRLTDKIDEFWQVHGRNPAIHEVAETVSPSPIRAAVEPSPVASRMAQESAERSMVQVPGELADRSTAGLLRGRISPTPEKVQQVASREFGRFINQNGSTVVPHDAGIADMLRRPEVARLVYRNATDETAMAARELLDGNDIALKHVDKIRKRIGDAISNKDPNARNYSMLRDVRESLANYADNTAPGYRKTLAAFSARQNIAEGIVAGRKINTQADPTSFRDAYVAADPATQLGMRWGARSAIRTTIGESPEGVIGDLRKLAQDPGLHRRLSAFLPEEEVATMVEGAKTAYTALLSRRANTPTSTKATNKTAEMLRDLAEAGVIVTGRGSGGFIVSVLKRVMTGLDMSESARRKVAELAYDPARLPEVMEQLQKAGVGPDQFRKAMNQAVLSGQIAGAE